MHVGVLTEGIDRDEIETQPWVYHRTALAADGIRIELLPADDDAFARRFDVMMLHVWRRMRPWSPCRRRAAFPSSI
jgi:hypothetical protein